MNVHIRRIVLVLGILRDEAAFFGEKLQKVQDILKQHRLLRLCPTQARWQALVLCGEELARMTDHVLGDGSLTKEILHEIALDGGRCRVAESDDGCQDLAQTKVLCCVCEGVRRVGGFRGQLTGNLVKKGQFASRPHSTVCGVTVLTLLLLSMEALMTGPIQYSLDSSKTVWLKT